MKKTIIIILFCSVIILAQSTELTLQESLRLGLKNSKELKIAKSKITKAEAMQSEIASSMLPQISINAAYRRLSDVHPFQLKLPMFPQPVTIQETILDNYSISASVQQALFTGFKLSSLKSAATLSMKAESLMLKKAEINKAEEIQKAFWHLYNAKVIVNLIKENLNSLEHHLRDTENFLKNGLVTKNDLLKLKVELSNSKLKLLEAENKRYLAKTMFNKVLGLPLNKNTKIKVNEIIIDTLETDYSKLKEEALKNRSEIKSVSLKVKVLDEKETAALSDWYPQLFAFGNFYYSKPNQRYLPVENKFNDSWDVGIALKWNLWTWGKTSAKAQQAEEDKFQAEENLKLLKEAVQLDVYNNYLKLLTAKEKINISKIQIESATENYRITKEKYEQQLATSTELIYAETSLLNAKTKLISSQVEYKLGKAALDKAIGKRIIKFEVE